MLDFFLGVLGCFVRAVNFVLEIWVSISRLRRFARIVITGRLDSDPEIKVLPDPKILPPAAERALAEAEQRRRNGPA